MAAPLLIVLVTWYHAHDGSSMAGMLWLWSIPVALIVYAVPGLLLLVAPRWALPLQVLPALFTGYVVLVVLATILR